MGLIPGLKTDKKKVKEERTPRQIAESYAYKSDKDGTYYVPSTYVTGAFIEAASNYKDKSSSRKSLKSVAAGAFFVVDEKATLLELKKDKPLKSFEVDIRKATNHLKGAVAVIRPRFDEWRVKLTASVDEDLIPLETAHSILSDAGRRVGIGSFRISKRGYFGSFQITKWDEKPLD